MLEIKILQNPKLIADVPESGQFEYAPIPGAEHGLIAVLSYVGQHGYPYSFRTVLVKQADQTANDRAVFNYQTTSVAC